MSVVPTANPTANLTVAGSWAGRADDAARRPARDAAVFAAVVILAHLPLFVWHLRSLWLYRPHYQFYPLLLAGSAWLLWKRWPRWSASMSPPWWSTALLAGGLVVLAASVLFFSPWLAAVATVLSVGGLIGRYAVPGQGGNWLPVWAVMWLIVPPPLRWDFRLIVWLQSSTSRMASMVLDVMGVRHLMEGNVLVLPGHRMLVEEACSGVNSLLVLLAVTALFVVAARRPLLWATLLLVSGFAWAWLANVARVVTVALSQAWYQVDLSSGWRHELLGYVAILLALALLASTDRCLAFLLRPVPPREDELPRNPRRRTNPVTRLWNWCMGPASRTAQPEVAVDSFLPEPAAGARRPSGWLAGFGLLGTLQIACFAVPAGARHVPVETVTFSRSDMPASLDGWTLVKHEQVKRSRSDYLGQFSSVWLYHREPLVCQVSVDYPFPEWHELMLCYRNSGWVPIDRRVTAVEEEGGASGAYVEVELSKPSGEYGWLLFGLFDHAGDHLAPPTETAGERTPSVIAKLARSPLVSRLLGRGSGAVIETAYQVQTFVSGAVRLSPEQRGEVRRLFVAARSQVLAAYLQKTAEAERKP